MITKLTEKKTRSLNIRKSVNYLKRKLRYHLNRCDKVAKFKIIVNTLFKGEKKNS